MPAETASKAAPKAASSSPPVSSDKPVVRPDLNPKLADLVERAKKAKSEEVFFSWLAGDTALIQITNRKVIKTRVGKSALYAGVYLQGNIEGRPGAPEKSGDSFGFYAQTVLESMFERLGIVQHGEDPNATIDNATNTPIADGKVLAEPNVVVVVSCLGEKEGKSYYDFVVKRLEDDDLALSEGNDVAS